MKAAPAELAAPFFSRHKAFFLNTLVPCAALFAITVWFCRGWLEEGVTVGDLPGSVAWLWHYKNAFFGVEEYSTWNPWWFCGHSFVLINLGLLRYLLVMPFAFLVNDLNEAMKVACVFAQSTAGAFMFFFARYLFKSTYKAFFAGLCYAIHPIVIAFGFTTSHLEFPFYYPVVPIFFLCVAKLAKETSFKNLFFASLAIFAAIWIDTERFAVTLPFLIVYFIYERTCLLNSKGMRLPHIIKENAVPLILLGMLTSLIGFFVMFPAFYENRYHTLFEEGTLLKMFEQFTFNNPYYVFDRHGELVRSWGEYLPGTLTGNAGMFYIGLIPFFMISFYLMFWDRTLPHYRYFFLFFICTILAVWISFGSHSIYEQASKVTDLLLKDRLFVRSGEYPKFLSVFFLLFFFPAFIFGIRSIKLRASGQKPNYTLLALLPALIFIILFTRPFMYLRKFVFLYSRVRGVTYFTSIFPPFALSICSVYAFYLLERIISRKYSVGIAFGILVSAMLFDFSPYQKDFHLYYEKGVMTDLRNISRKIRQDSETCRTLCRESYSPLFDMSVLYSNTPSAWAWLNWDSPKHQGDFIMNHVYAKLHRPETIDEALENAGYANVKYLVFSLFEGPPPPPTDNLTLVMKTANFLLYENRLFKKYAEVFETSGDHNPDSLLKIIDERHVKYLDFERNSPTTITVDVEVDRGCILGISESWYPGWYAVVDGYQTPSQRVNHSFQGVVLSPGKHTVVFKYQKPIYFLLSAAVSIVTIGASMLMIFFHLPKSGGKISPK